MGNRDANKHNLEAYCKISADEMRKIAITGGIDSGCDVAIIKPYILKSSAIFEVGAGYGRVLEHIVKTGYEGNISAIEYNPKFCNILQESFSEHVDILNEDLCETNITKKFDCILWLWNGISDFSKQKQPEVLQKLLNMLIPGGVLIFDTFPLIADPLYSIKIKEKEYYIKVNQETIRVYCPTLDDVNNYGDYLNVTERKHVEYLTDIGRKRIMHIFTKPKENNSQ
jgi:phospholipid N-methyltransferase